MLLIELIVLIGCQLLGNWLVDVLNAPVPGPVAGMGLLFLYLLVRGGPSESMTKISQPLLKHMALLFIPAGSGVLLFTDRVTNEWVPITIALLISTLVTLLTAAWMMERLAPEVTEQDAGDV